MELPEPATVKSPSSAELQAKKMLELVTSEPSAPAETYTGLPSTETSDPAESQPSSPEDTGEVQPLDKGKAAVYGPSITPEGGAAELANAATDNVPSVAHPAQPPPSIATPKTPGHSANPSSSANTTTEPTPLTPRTRQTSKSSVSSDDITNYKCPCRMVGEGKDRRQVYCSAHDPNLEESLQSALQNTGPEIPSDDSDTDPRPHLEYLHPGDPPELPNLHHAPVVSADPAIYEENRLDQPVSPPPGYVESHRGQYPQSHIGLPSTLADAEAASSPPTNQETTQHNLDSISTAGASLDAQRSPPPTFQEAVAPVNHPPSYMGIASGDGHIAGQSSEQVARDNRRSRIKTGQAVMGDWPDWCGDWSCGLCRWAGTVFENVKDVCVMM